MSDQEFYEDDSTIPGGSPEVEETWVDMAKSSAEGAGGECDLTYEQGLDTG